MTSARRLIILLSIFAITGAGLWLALRDRGPNPGPELLETPPSNLVVKKPDGTEIVPADQRSPTIVSAGEQEPVGLPNTSADHVPTMRTTSESPLPNEKVPNAAIQGSDVEPTGIETTQPTREFPISRSVVDACEQVENGTCANEVMDLIKLMNDEPEDQAWSAQAEARLRSFLSADEKQLEIRAVECRKTICAIEAASAYGPIYGSIKSDNWLDANMRLWNGLNGYERDEMGGRITVSLRTYRRR